MAERARLNPDKDLLTVTFEGGEKFALPAEYLRVESPSAEVQGHGPLEKTIVPRKRTVKIRALEPVGRYAVRIVFDDGHDTGLFTWAVSARARQRAREEMGGLCARADGSAA